MGSRNFQLKIGVCSAFQNKEFEFQGCSWIWVNQVCISIQVMWCLRLMLPKMFQSLRSWKQTIVRYFRWFYFFMDRPIPNMIFMNLPLKDFGMIVLETYLPFCISRTQNWLHQSLAFYSAFSWSIDYSSQTNICWDMKFPKNHFVTLWRNFSRFFFRRDLKNDDRNKALVFFSFFC